MSEELKANVSAPKVEASITETEYLEHSKFGSIDEEGNVYVIEGDEKRLIGQFPTDIPERPFELYIRRYLDIKTQISLFNARIANLNLKDLKKPLSSLESMLDSPSIMGDIEALKNLLEETKKKVEERTEQLLAQRDALREETLALRTAIVEKAEELATKSKASINWRESAQTLHDLLEEWKTSQRNGPRLERKVENELWKRFSVARTTFDRHRRQYFSNLDKTQAEGKALKENIVARAQELVSSTEWAKTASAFQDLLSEWKKAPKARRKIDDELWEKFRAAQNTFFDAKNEHQATVNAEFSQNLELKNALLERAEALLPIENLEETKSKFHDILDEWDKIGRVNRTDAKKINARLRAVEDAISHAEQDSWQRSNPETKVRALSLISLLESSIPKLEKELEKAKDTNNEAKVQKLEAELESKKQWLEQALKTVEQ